MEEGADDRASGRPGAIEVEHRPERKRFEVRLEDGGEPAVLEYLEAGKSLIFTHTGVPEAFEGRGVGGALARAGLGFVRDHGLIAVPLCPFVRAYIRRHPEHLELVGFGRRGDRLC